MILIHVSKITPRKEYLFKHVFKRLLQQDYQLTIDLKEFVEHKGVKLSYGLKPLGDELYIWSYGLLDENGIEIHDIKQCTWNSLPAFFAAPRSSKIPFDVFSATFYLITRYEEYLPQVKDDHGRYDPAESIAVKAKFIQLPIIDIWAQHLLAKLNEVFETNLSRSRETTATVAIETSNLRKYKWRGLIPNVISIFLQLKSLQLKQVVRQCMVHLGVSKDPYDNEDYILSKLSEASGQRRSLGNSSKQVLFFFHLGSGKLNNPFRNKKFIETVKHIADYVKIGLRYSENCTSQDMKLEARRFEQIFTQPLVQTMAAHSKIEIPGHYKQLVDVDKIQDYSMGYVNMPGFRAGTSMPYYFYDLDYEVQTPLLIHPYALHYKSIEGRMLNGQKQIIQQIADRVREVSGDFIVMFDYRQFHNKRTTHVKTILHNILNYEL
jgi:hypothetical protein